jgi:hypothetical protein
LAEPTRLAANAGIAAVIFHAVGTAGLAGIEAAYHPTQLDRWAYAVADHELSAAWSGGAHAAAMLALLVWGVGLVRLLGAYALPGGVLLLAAALTGGAGSVLPWVVSHFVPHGEEAIAQSMLGVALAFAGLYRAILALAVLLLTIAVGRDVRFPMVCFVLGVVAAFVCAPLIAVAWSPVAADFAVVGDMVWLSWVLVMSVLMFRSPADVGAAQAEARAALRARTSPGR